MNSQGARVAALLGDLVRSRSADDRASLHAGLSGVLAATNEQVAPLHRLRVTVGDEFQGVYDTVGAALVASYRIRLGLIGLSDVRFGIGVGGVAVVDADAGIQDGSAWWAAREAIQEVEQRADRPTHACLRTMVLTAPEVQPVSAELPVALAGLDVLLGRLDDRSRRILAGFVDGRPQRAIADDEGVSPSAVSQRVRRDALEIAAECIDRLGGAA